MAGSADSLDPPDDVRLALVHPMRAWAEALETLVEARPDITLVSTHTTLAWAAHSVVNGGANVLLLHVADQESDLGPVLRDLYGGNDELDIVVLSDLRDPGFIADVVRAGVRAWVQPTASFDHLVRVLVGARRGESWFPPDLIGSVLDILVEAAEKRDEADGVLASLTSRELDILQCLVHGLTRQEIAERYFLSPHTVRTHINHVLHKLDVHTTLAAVSLARRLGVELRSITEQDGTAGYQGSQPPAGRPALP